MAGSRVARDGSRRRARPLHRAYRGPWGTSYPANLRLYMQGLSERDLRALYRYVRHLGSAETPAPAYVPPQGNPTAPYVQFPAPPK